MSDTLSLHREGLLAYYDIPISTGPLKATRTQTDEEPEKGGWAPAVPPVSFVRYPARGCLQWDVVGDETDRCADAPET